MPPRAKREPAPLDGIATCGAPSTGTVNKARRHEEKARFPHSTARGLAARCCTSRNLRRLGCGGGRDPWQERGVDLLRPTRSSLGRHGRVAPEPAPSIFRPRKRPGAGRRKCQGSALGRRAASIFPVASLIPCPLTFFAQSPMMRASRFREQEEGDVARTSPKAGRVPRTPPSRQALFDAITPNAQASGAESTRRWRPAVGSARSSVR
jgi:hypothetical protein